MKKGNFHSDLRLLHFSDPRFLGAAGAGANGAVHLAPGDLQWEKDIYGWLLIVNDGECGEKIRNRPSGNRLSMCLVIYIYIPPVKLVMTGE